eukprot:344524_1
MESMFSVNYVLPFLIDVLFGQSSSYLCNDTSMFKCNWTVDGYELDLTVFQRIGMNLTFQDIDYNYSFSPCNNLQPDYTNEPPYNPYLKYMAIQYNETDINPLAS